MILDPSQNLTKSHFDDQYIAFTDVSDHFPYHIIYTQ